MYGNKNEIQDKIDVNKFQLRAVEAYPNHCTLISQNPELANSYGLKSNSCLSSLEYFHVIDGLPFDIAHDLF